MRESEPTKLRSRLLDALLTELSDGEQAIFVNLE
jgi:hypothetical protein